MASSGAERPEARRHVLAPDEDRLRLGQQRAAVGGAVSSRKRRPDVRGVGREGEADRGGVRLKTSFGPELGCDLGELRASSGSASGPSKASASAFSSSAISASSGCLAKPASVSQKFRKVAAEIPRALPVRRMGGDIGLGELGETGIAEIGMQLLVVVGQHLGEAGDISVAVDAEQHFAALPWRCP